MFNHDIHWTSTEQGSWLLSGLNKDLFEKLHTIHVSRLRRHQSGKIKILILNLIQAGIPTKQNTDQVFRTFINEQNVTADLSQGLSHNAVSQHNHCHMWEKEH